MLYPAPLSPGRISEIVLAARFFDSRPSFCGKPSQKPHAKNPTFVRSIRQWRAGSITVGRGTRFVGWVRREAA